MRRRFRAKLGTNIEEVLEQIVKRSRHLKESEAELKAPIFDSFVMPTKARSYSAVSKREVRKRGQASG